ncbi:hypothetical protein POX_d05736 [Penicillium oxalicum]|uniref:Uncharacterized protein n=1 Tax=Penicillium oxalicum (strain 114-2 / CGMCC 5302) TaxID=933388 RepID=S7ZN33_PENO1|nr:hypothetical protein POX_d05736 [Penicillium oxalicum]EPS32090.1 hypothetical protein PDE_07049 [Penicillium oxalicum 114-2]KAI2790229.1 hypothetical protein POX_d05736 [Penicillium oxalicum]
MEILRNLGIAPDTRKRKVTTTEKKVREAKMKMEIKIRIEKKIKKARKANINASSWLSVRMSVLQCCADAAREGVSTSRWRSLAAMIDKSLGRFRAAYEKSQRELILRFETLACT